MAPSQPLSCFTCTGLWLRCIACVCVVATVPTVSCSTTSSRRASGDFFASRLSSSRCDTTGGSVHSSIHPSSMPQRAGGRFTASAHCPVSPDLRLWRQSSLPSPCCSDRREARSIATDTSPAADVKADDVISALHQDSREGYRASLRSEVRRRRHVFLCESRNAGCTTFLPATKVQFVSSSRLRGRHSVTLEPACSVRRRRAKISRSGVSLSDHCAPLRCPASV